jgi:quercetin dioxygenase-like cupin family protein
MSTQSVTKNTQEPNHDEQRLTANGTLFEFLTSPDETGSEICLIRGTMPAGAAVPLHSHGDAEIFYVLEGSVEVFQAKSGIQGWVRLGPGNVVSISGNTKHALRNGASGSATIMVVTTSKLYKFFLEVTKPLDPDKPAAPPTREEGQNLLKTAARYGYWMGSPEDNAAIGLARETGVNQHQAVVALD